MFKNLSKHLTYDEKEAISKIIFRSCDAEMIADYKNLQKFNVLTESLLSTFGNKFINAFTGIERLNTMTAKNITFYDFYVNCREMFLEKPYVQKYMLHEEKHRSSVIDENTFDIMKWYRFFGFYMGSVSTFRPVIAKSIYIAYNPKVVLDFTMGWGGRLLGACVLNVQKYIGIDSNLNLKDPYERMKLLLEQQSTTEINLYFQDCLTIDYSKLFYDFVFTSPPYYNTEIYGDEKITKTKKQWNDDFYIPIFSVTFQYLQPGGYYCINVPSEIYESVLIPLFGQAHKCIEYTKRRRTAFQCEYIYVYKKEETKINPKKRDRKEYQKAYYLANIEKWKKKKDV
jgi:hypothetical protein